MPRIRPIQLADARRRAKLTQEDLAELAGVARSTINKLEKGGQLPRPDTAARLQQVLETRLNAGRIDLVFPNRVGPVESQNGTGTPPHSQPVKVADDDDAVVRRLDDGTWELTVDAFKWFVDSEDDERSSPLFWPGLREFIRPRKPGQVLYAPSVNVTAVIHVASLSPAIAARLRQDDEAWVDGADALGLLIGSNTFESGPDEPSWGSITLLPWHAILGISNEHYVAAGARRYPREQAPAPAPATPAP